MRKGNSSALLVSKDFAGGEEPSTHARIAAKVVFVSFVFLVYWLVL